MLRWMSLILPYLAVLLAAAPASSAPVSSSEVVFSAPGNAEPLELARLVERQGDGAVLAALDPRQPVELRLIAIRAAAWMKSPTSALTALADILASRDSELAPAAARAAARIVRSIDADYLQTMEILPSELTAARGKLMLASRNVLLRNDIQLLAAQAAERLRAAGVGGDSSR